MYTCPVLDYHQAAPALALFRECYRLQTDALKAPRYERVALPVAGGVEDQPARLVATLSLIEAVLNNLLLEWTKKRKRAPQEDGDKDTDV